MSTDIRAQIHNNFHQKETDELVQIWQANNHAEYTDQAFEIIGEILQERQVPLPPQAGPGDDETRAQVENDVTQMGLVQIYFSFKGRISRQTFWLLGILPIAGWSILFGVLEGATPYDSPYSGLSIGVSRLLIIWPVLALTAKRLHDCGESGWFQLMGLVPILGPLWVFIQAGLVPGDKGPNQFGSKSF